MLAGVSVPLARRCAVGTDAGGLGWIPARVLIRPVTERRSSSGGPYGLPTGDLVRMPSRDGCRRTMTRWNQTTVKAVVLPFSKPVTCANRSAVERR